MTLKHTKLSDESILNLMYNVSTLMMMMNYDRTN